MPEDFASFTHSETEMIEALVAQYSANFRRFENFTENLRALIVDAPQLEGLVHSTKWRVKKPNHLRDKLIRKLATCKAEHLPFEIDENNLFEKVNDLAGFRVLHLHTKQMAAIDKALRELFEDENWILAEPPFAHTWDNTSRDYFTSIGIRSEENPRLYTSVHYIVKSNKKANLTGEVQVRTLAEEIWGEVDHAINYPHKSSVVACVEQIKIRASVTLSCRHVVDSIFATHSDALRQDSSLTV